MKETIPPTKRELKNIVGKQADKLFDLMEFIEGSYQIEGEWKHYKKGGWTLFYRKSGKSLCYINFNEGGFVVTVIIGVSLNDQFTELSLSQQTKEMFKQAKQYHDGKWLKFDVTSQRDLADIKTLIQFKKKPVAT